MPRVLTLSDTHFIPLKSTRDTWDLSVDLVVHAGDLTWAGDLEQVKAALEWLQELGKPVVFTPGNHDWLFQRNLDQVKRMLVWTPDIHLLIDEEVTVAGVRIWGSPWNPVYFDWAFNLPRGKPLREKWDHIPEGLDILLTHTPPAHHLDKTRSGQDAGCGELRKAVERTKPRYHVFGHIHEGYGIEKTEHTTYVNAAVCDREYKHVNMPQVIEI